MADSQENIEAMLSAYIDDELDEAGRAEIQRHLEANPSHRTLLEELKRARDFVRALPRATAPGDLSETLQGQLERSSLLDGDPSSEATLTLKPNRWPQLVSIAAVVLLAVGLGTVVYVALPHGAPKATVARGEGSDVKANAPDGMVSDALRGMSTRPTTTMSIIPPAPIIAGMPPEAVARADGPSRDEAGADRAGFAGERAATTLPLETSAPIATSAPVPVAPSDERVATTSPAFGVTTTGNSVALGFAPPANAPKDAVFLVVNSSNLSFTNARVTGYFATNNIAYESLDASATDDVADADVKLGNTPAVEPVGGAKSSPSQPTSEAQATAQNAAEDRSQRQAQLQQQARNTDQLTQDYQRQYGGGTQQPVEGQAKEASPSKSESQLKSKSSYASDSMADRFPLAPNAKSDASLDANAGGGAGSGAGGGGAQRVQNFYARKMTVRQVRELESQLTSPNVVGEAKQEVVLVDPGKRIEFKKAQVKDAEPEPRADAVRDGDELQVTVDELVGPGVEKSNRVRVAQDGQIAMPMIEPVKVRGLTTDEASKEVGRRYRESHLITSPTVRVARVAPTPATNQSSAAPTAGVTTAPTADGSPAASEELSKLIRRTDPEPTTQPFVAPSSPDESDDVAHDVVVVVQALGDQPAPPVTPTTTPTTSPVATRPTTGPTTLP
jgi:hypothetical protein